MNLKYRILSFSLFAAFGAIVSFPGTGYSVTDDRYCRAVKDGTSCQDRINICRRDCSNLEYRCTECYSSGGCKYTFDFNLRRCIADSGNGKDCPKMGENSTGIWTAYCGDKPSTAASALMEDDLDMIFDIINSDTLSN